MFVYLWYVGMRPGPGTDALSHHDSAWPIGFHKNYKLFFFSACFDFTTVLLLSFLIPPFRHNSSLS